jgi:UDP-N-acetylglucosamine--dolichyl-phosphate N-acetylglucosaminephosphotransferase
VQGVISYSFGLIVVLSFLVSFGITYATLPFLIRYLTKKGITGTDIHKLSKPEIPEMGGLAILIGIITSLVILQFIMVEYRYQLLAFISVTFLAGCIGIYDDLRGLGPKKKPFLLTILAMGTVFPLLLFGVVTPRPLLPIIGKTRLTIIYWIVLPLAIAVPANAVNMLDVFNGSMAITCIIASLALLTCAILLDSPMGIIFCLSLIGTLFAFLMFNKIPAKVFSGNVGSLTVGAAIGAIAVIGRLEIAAIIALMPQIMNAFHILTSMGGLKEGKTLRKRPIKILSDGKLAANPDKDAPLTLTRLILARGPLEEDEVVKIFAILSLFAAIMAIISIVITPL